MAKVRYKLYVDKDFGTVSIRNPRTGKFLGRKSVRGIGDRTAVRRVSAPKEYSGQIMGRTSPISVKGSSRARGYVRRL